MAYEKECPTCGKTIEISNELRRKGSVIRDNQTIEAIDIHGNIIYKTNIDLSMGKCHDYSDYYCSKDCMQKRETAEQL